MKVRFVSKKDIVLIAGKRDNRDYRHCRSFMWWVIKVIKGVREEETVESFTKFRIILSLTKDLLL